ncbi:hypothetical protein BZG36_01497 [Bifiguratus adelaidae]|uniref:Uncharacterized protein n=1 Tax=Bifiguratus adelaidae TaxID=1938954 RepID=A0A261Y4U1_9FUNG|nr:hypothetical protein BZG36_01497 [Bifiguratus adelaidae]
MTGDADANERDEPDNPQVAINVFSEGNALPTQTTTGGTDPADQYESVLHVWWNSDQSVCVFCFKLVSDERKTSLRLNRWRSDYSDKLEHIKDVPYDNNDDPHRIRIDCSDDLRYVVIVVVWEQRPTEVSKLFQVRGPESLEELYTGYIFQSPDTINYTMSKLDLQARYPRIYITDVAIFEGKILFSAIGQSFDLCLMVIPYDLTSRHDGGAVGLEPRILHTPETTLYDKFGLWRQRNPEYGASPDLKMYRVQNGDLVFSFTGAKGSTKAPEIVWSNDMFVLILETIKASKHPISGRSFFGVEWLNLCSLRTGCVIYRGENSLGRSLAKDDAKVHIVTDLSSVYFGMGTVLYMSFRSKTKTTFLQFYDIASACDVGPALRWANCDHRFVRCTKDYQFGSLHLAGTSNVTTAPPIELQSIVAKKDGVLNVEYN